MSLARIPFILATLAGGSITYTPPNPPPSPKESERVEQPKSIRIALAVPITKAVIWIFALVEVSAILATQFPATLFSQAIITVLLPSDRAGPGSTRIGPNALAVLNASMTTIAGLIRWKCYRTMGRQYTFDMALRDGHKLVTRGPYRFVRHPGYTSGIMATIGTLAFFGSRGSWLRESGILNSSLARIFFVVLYAFLLLPISTFPARISKEDDALHKEFGKSWEEWAKKVPYRWIPGIY